MRPLLLTLSFALSLATLGFSQIRNKPPETFSASAQARTAGGAAAAVLRIHVDRYTTDDERDAAVKALQTGGSAGLTAALRKSAAIGYVEVGDKKWTIRFARQQQVPKGRQIVAVVDQPMFFVGGGQAAPKTREGFDLAVIQFEVDEIGMGQGTMAAAAQVKPGGPAGVELADYADEPIKLVTVTKVIS